MYKRFAFEGDIHTSLSCVPLTVRRKLDLAGLKVSLAGWQDLAREERLSLCHLPVDTPEDLAIYREVMQAFCDRRGVPYKPLHDPRVIERPWNDTRIPADVAERAAAAGSTLDDNTWSMLDEESRYALCKLADPKRTPEKLSAALFELGLLAAPPPEIHATVAVCEAAPIAPADMGAKSKTLL